jgi:hypothetical protein
MNMTCLLPDYCMGVTMWEPHPCGGYYMVEAWCYGPHGRIGYWLDAPGLGAA